MKRSTIIWIGLAAFALAAIAVNQYAHQNAQQIGQVLPWIAAGAAMIAVCWIGRRALLAFHPLYMHHIERVEAKQRLQHADERHKHDLEMERIERSRQLVPPGHSVMARNAVAGEYTPFTAPALPAARKEHEQVVDADPQIPTAPAFRDMMHLISESRMPLCYTVENGRSVPAWGTVDDLLSMAIIGKPGRGKTTALMFYICILLKIGAEVWIWDPHGSMSSLAAISHIPLAGMPATAQLVYLDRREDAVNSVTLISGILEERDEEYRAARARGQEYHKHPILLLADELPVLGDWDEKTKREYKTLNAQRKKRRLVELETPRLVDVMRRFVLEARKWRGFFIGSGQVLDAEILPTKVTDSLSSRIVFFSAERKARMAGLEKPAIDELLPVIRRAGEGIMVFDCARWDEPVVGAIPYIGIEDMVKMLAVDPHQGGDIPQITEMPDLPAREDIPGGHGGHPRQTSTEPLPALPGTSPGDIPDSSPSGTMGDLSGTSGDIPGGHPRMAFEKERLFLGEYRKRLRIEGSTDIKAVMRHCKIGNRYHRHASELARQVKETQ